MICFLGLLTAGYGGNNTMASGNKWTVTDRMRWRKESYDIRYHGIAIDSL